MGYILIFFAKKEGYPHCGAVCVFVCVCVGGGGGGSP